MESVIEVRVPEVRRLFNAIDPSPFRDKDIDPAAEEFIVSWAKELPRTNPLALVVHVDQSVPADDDGALLTDAIHEFFKQRAVAFRQRLKMLFRTGRTSLVIGLGFLALSTAVADLLATSMKGNHFADILREGVTIGGWVALWRPLEIFLYDWWPIRAEARLADRLAVMPVRVRYLPAPTSLLQSRGGRIDPLRVVEGRFDADSRVDQAIAESFPASDAPSWNSGLDRT